MPQLSRAMSTQRSGRKRRAGPAWLISDEVPEGVAWVLAIDPGARHCGMAWFELTGEDEWACVDTEDLEPLDCLRTVQSYLRADQRPGMLVIEEFRLYPDRMAEQALTALGTVEVIGALRWLIVDSRRTFVGLSMQGASIKTPGARRMQEMGIPHRGTNQHQRDAEMHGWFWILARWANA